MTFKRLILFSLLFKLIVIPFFFHPDILWIYNSSLNLIKNNIYNIYEYENNMGEVLFKYPPLAYFFFGIYGILINIFDKSVIWSYDWVSWLKNISVFRMLLLMKIPFLIADYSIFYILCRYKKDYKKQLIYLWLFNPVIIYFIYIYGQFDIIPTVLMLISYILFLNEKKLSSIILLALSAAFKNYALILLPFWALFLSENIKNFIKYFITGISIYLLTISPFITSISFLNNVLFYSGGYLLGDGFVFTKSAIANLLFFIFYGAVFIFILIKNRFKFNKDNLLNIIILILMAYYLLYDYNPQFCIWILPFLILYQLNNFSKYNIIFFIVINLFFLNRLIPFGRNTFSIHLAPINKILYGLPSPASIIEYTVGLNRYLTTTKYIFNILIILFIIKILKNLDFN